MNGVQGFKRLIAEQRADELASMVCLMSREVAETDRRLTSQVSLSAMSAPSSNVARYERGSLGDYRRFSDITRGPLCELEGYLHLSKLGFIAESDIERADILREETGRLLNGLWKNLHAKETSAWDKAGGLGRIREVSEIYEVEV